MSINNNMSELSRVNIGDSVASDSFIQALDGVADLVGDDVVKMINNLKNEMEAVELAELLEKIKIDRVKALLDETNRQFAERLKWQIVDDATDGLLFSLGVAAVGTSIYKLNKFYFNTLFAMPDNCKDKMVKELNNESIDVIITLAKNKNIPFESKKRKQLISELSNLYCYGSIKGLD